MSGSSGLVEDLEVWVSAQPLLPSTHSLPGRNLRPRGA